MAYATAGELRDRLGKVSPAKDDLLLEIISAAEKSINKFVNRPDGFEAATTATARTYAGSGKGYRLIDECVSITTVAVKESYTDTTYTAWLATDWIAFSGDPKSPDFQPLIFQRPYNAIMIDPSGSESGFYSGSVGGYAFPTVQVTAKWGYCTSVPDDIREACLIQATRLYKRFESGMSDTLASNDFGVMIYRQSLDPEAKQLLVAGRYIKPVVGRW
jgi:hypothetical protein